MSMEPGYVFVPQEVKQDEVLTDSDEPLMTIVPSQPMNVFLENLIKYFVSGSRIFIFIVTKLPLSIVWTAIRFMTSFIFLFYFNGRSTGTNSLVTEQDIELGIGEHLRKLNVIRAQACFDDLRNYEYEEEKHEKRMEALRRKSRARRADMLAAMQAETSKLNDRVENQERDISFENRIADYQESNMLRNQQAQLDTGLMEIAGASNADELRMYQERKIENMKKVEEVNKNIANNSSKFQEKESQRRVEIENEERRYEEKMMEIREQLARDLEKMHARDAQRKAEMENQLQEIHRMLRNKMWNEIIENNWTRRLNTLRSANDDVKKVWMNAKRHQKNGQLPESHKEQSLAVIDSERTLMEQESREMEKMYDVTRKSFLLTIKDSVEQVHVRCTEFVESVEKNRSIVDLEKCYNNLCQASISIPTLAELKRQYTEQMK